MKKKLFIKTWGCQMNVYDSGRMADVVTKLGYSCVESAEDADLVIFNTCHIREKAAEKMFSELGRLRPFQKAKAEKGERMIVAVAGCVAQAEGEEIQKRAPYVDIVLGPQTYHMLPEMIAIATRKTGGVLNTDFPAEPKFDHLPSQTKSNISAFLSVQEGCDKFCSYCVVPYTRGAEYSRPASEILDEAKRLVDLGAKEITLLGQNVNAFHGIAQDGIDWGLGKLLRSIADIPRLLRLRYTTSHPRNLDDEIIAAHKDIPKLMPFLHLPVQSGSDGVLKAMNRGHVADDYLRLIEKLRNARPDIALSSDFIVGFPGESEDDHKATLRLVQEVGFAQAFSFKYSKRPGTPAASMTGQIAEDVKDARLQELQELLKKQQLAFNKSMVGKTLPILFDDDGTHEGMVFGRTPYLQSTYVTASAETISGQEKNVIITTARLSSLTGDAVV